MEGTGTDESMFCEDTGFSESTHGGRESKLTLSTRSYYVCVTDPGFNESTHKGSSIAAPAHNTYHSHNENISHTGSVGFTW